MYRHWLKHFIDKVAALTALVLTMPISLLVFTLLMISLKGNPMFFQPRGGQHDKVFNVIKFRTMSSETDVEGYLLPDAERLTTIGRVVRKLSLDEIPQLINVLRGEMSLIGPRPFMAEYLTIYTDDERRRHDVRPGITGWAQVNGRNSITWKERFALDLYYVDHLSFRLDLRILLTTVLKLVSREGVDQGALTTMEKYNGNN